MTEFCNFITQWCLLWVYNCVRVISNSFMLGLSGFAYSVYIFFESMGLALCLSRIWKMFLDVLWHVHCSWEVCIKELIISIAEA